MYKTVYRIYQMFEEYVSVNRCQKNTSSHVEYSSLTFGWNDLRNPSSQAINHIKVDITIT